MIKAGVGMSIKDNAYEAGRDVAKKALNDINGKPKLAILAVDSLSRVKHNYNDVLKGVREVLGNKIKLIGSTVNGIIVNDRFALRSVGLMLLGGNFSLNTSFNYGNSRIEYEKIADKIYNRVRSFQKNDNNFLLLFQDGLKFPPEVLEKQETLNSRVVSMFSGLVKIFFKRQLEELKETGMGMPSTQDLLEKLYSKGWKNQIIGNVASNMRDYDSVQFYDDKVIDDSVIGVSLSPQNSNKFGFGFSAGAESTGRKCEITKNIGNFLLRVDDEKALIGFCEAAGIQLESLRELKYSEYVNFHNIIGTKQRINGEEFIHLSVTQTNPNYKSLILTTFPFNKVPEEIEIFRSNMDILIETAKESVSQALEGISDPSFLLGFDCGIRFVAYGNNLPLVVEEINDTIGKDIPKMIVGSGGEIFGTKKIDYYQNSLTFVSLAGGKK